MLLLVLREGRRALHLRRREVLLLDRQRPGRALRRSLLVVRDLVHGVDRAHSRGVTLHGSGGGRLDALAHERQQVLARPQLGLRRPP